MSIPVKLVGVSPGVLNGGSLRFAMRKLSVRALPADLPDFINADISKLRIGHKLYVTALKNDKFSILHPENTVVVQVRTARSAVLTDDEDEEGEEGAAEDGAAEETSAE
jgi:large subunit ribosomal protein L25